MSSQNQIRENITATFVRMIEDGGLPPWRQTWKSGVSGFPTNGVTNKSYTGINPMILACHQVEHGFSSSLYATYNQWASVGAQVMRRPSGVKTWGCQIVFCRPMTKEVANKDGSVTEEKFLLLRNYHVFNLEQTTGGEVEHLREPDTRVDFDVFEDAEKVISSTGADIRYGGGRCFYDADRDYIQVPRPENFSSEFYESVFHELVHWTEHPDRRNWDRSKRGPNAYAEAELIAEIGACYVCSEIGIPPTDFSNHCSYLDGWLRRMKQDCNFLFRCSAQASQAADYLLAFSREDQPKTPAIVS